MTGRIDYRETAQAARALGLTLAQADQARAYSMRGRDGRGFLAYDRARFARAAWLLAVGGGAL